MFVYLLYMKKHLSLLYYFRYNDIGFVPTTFVDHASLVRGMGTVNKDSLLRTLDFTIPRFAKDEMDCRQKITMPWYGFPIGVLSQMTNPINILTFFAIIIFVMKFFMDRWFVSFEE